MLGLVSELVVKVDEGTLDTRQPLLQSVAWASHRGQRHGAPLTGEGRCTPARTVRLRVTAL